MFKEYKLELRITDKLMGGIPKHPDVIKNWLDARMPTFAPPDAIPLEELAEQVAVQVKATEDAEMKVWTGFKGDDERGLYIDGYHVKAHLKDCANVLQKFTDIKALKSKLADRVFVKEDKLYLGKMIPDGYWEHAVHIMTMQGPRSALKRNDYVVQPIIRCTLKVLEDKVITEALLRTIFDFGSVRGFGAERGLGNGRYEYNLTTE